MRVAVAALLVAIGAAIGVLVMSAVLSSRINRLEYDRDQTFKVIDTTSAGIWKVVRDHAGSLHDINARLVKVEGH